MHDVAQSAAAPAGERDPLDNLVTFFETLSPHDLERIDQIYAADALFKDPFNEVRGHPAIRRVFEHMFETLDNPRFIICDRIASEGSRQQQAFVTWEFHFALRRDRHANRTSQANPARKAGAMQMIRGATHLQFDAAGRVTLHRDYWDAAEELYEKLPLLGTLMRWLKRRLKSPTI
jgi:steroid delta-isomerase